MRHGWEARRRGRGGHRGGGDASRLKARADVLSHRALDLKRAIEKRAAEPEEKTNSLT